MQALSGIGAELENRAQVTGNTALQSALETQFLFQIGVFTAIPMVMGFILEQGVFKVPFLGYLLVEFIGEFIFNVNNFVNFSIIRLL